MVLWSISKFEALRRFVKIFFTSSSVMNLPFKSVKKHMNSALLLLKRKDHAKPAVLVAFVPITYQHEEAESMEILPNNIFSTAKVNTKIIRIKR